MAESKRAKITIHFHDDTPFTGWESVTIRERFDDALGSYQVVLKPQFGQHSALTEQYGNLWQQIYLQKGELLYIKVDGRPYATPIIETITTEIDRRGGVVITVDCKSVLAAATEGSADPTIYEKQKADVPIADLVERVLKPFGGFEKPHTDTRGNVMTLSGKSPGGTWNFVTADELKAKDAQVQDNETAFGYCARLYSRLGVALRVDANGKLMLAGPNYDQNPMYEIFETTGDGDRVLKLTLRETNEGQFSRVVIRGRGEEKRRKKQTAKPQAALKQERLTGRFAGSDLESTAQANYITFSTDAPYGDIPHETFSCDVPLYTSSVQPYKPKFYVDKRSRDNERCASFCKLVYTKNAPKAFEVTAELDGLRSNSGAIWTVDTICRVQSPVMGFDQNMWVHEVSLTQSRRGSERAVVKLIPKYSLVLGDIPG